MSAAMIGAGKASTAALEGQKLSALKENTQTEIEKSKAEVEINKGKKMNEIDVKF